MSAFPELPSDEAKRLSGLLLAWFDRSHRILPWRSEPTPYRVWVSEIMLQQTRVEAVKPYFARFLSRLPDVAALAAADEDTLLSLWEGLGYYNRVRNMQRAAKAVMEQYGGQLPGTAEALSKLPGIGPYTAAAIASIAFGEAVPAVDGNVLRVLSRLFGIAEDILSARNKKEFTVLDGQLLLPERAGDFNQAMMELGATVCLPNGAPLCEKCPFQHDCRARAEGSVEFLPVRAEKKPRRVEERTVLLLTTPNGRFLLRRRPSRGLLAGMWEFPQVEGTLTAAEATAIAERMGFAVLQTEQLPSASHLFTHIEWQLSGWLLYCKEEVPVQGGVYLSMYDRAGYAIPSAFRVYTACAEEFSKKI